MPIYEYKCGSCQGQFEVMQRFKDNPLSRCADCGGPLTKLISNTSFVLKGGGWYADGYASSGKAAPSDKDNSKTAGKDAGKTTGKDGGKAAGKDKGASSSKASGSPAKSGEKTAA